MAAFAPMPRARESTATAVTNGVFPSIRAASLMCRIGTKERGPEMPREHWLGQCQRDEGRFPHTAEAAPGFRGGAQGKRRVDAYSSPGKWKAPGRRSTST